MLPLPLAAETPPLSLPRHQIPRRPIARRRLPRRAAVHRPPALKGCLGRKAAAAAQPAASGQVNRPPRGSPHEPLRVSWPFRRNAFLAPKNDRFGTDSRPLGDSRQHRGSFQRQRWHLAAGDVRHCIRLACSTVLVAKGGASPLRPSGTTATAARRTTTTARRRLGSTVREHVSQPSPPFRVVLLYPLSCALFSYYNRRALPLLRWVVLRRTRVASSLVVIQFLPLLHRQRGSHCGLHAVDPFVSACYKAVMSRSSQQTARNRLGLGRSRGTPPRRCTTPVSGRSRTR